MDDLLTRGVEKIYPNREQLATKLAAGPISIYHGIDPTAPTLHLGHLATLLKLRDFQQLGHKITILFGGLTATIGDPTDKSAARTVLSSGDVQANKIKIEKQVKSILIKSNFVDNYDWYEKMMLPEFIDLTTKITVQQSLKRDMFKKRQEAGRDIYLNELIYPLLHGYDSVELNVDMEIGGNDQTFNMLVGRDLMKKLKNKEKFVLATKLLVDPGGKKMGKTEGNMAALSDSPQELFGKVMSWPDTLMPLGFEILTRLPDEECENILTSHPKEAKLRLAGEVVRVIHGDTVAKEVRDNFEKVFSAGEFLSEEAVELQVQKGKTLVSVLVANGVVPSKSEFNRLVAGGGIEIIGEGKVVDVKTTITKPAAVRVGKHRFVKISLS